MFPLLLLKTLAKSTAGWVSPLVPLSTIRLLAVMISRDDEGRYGYWPSRMPARSRCSCYCIARPVAVPDVMMLAESNAGQISLIGLLHRSPRGCCWT
ncbi:hypothetical protein PF007_g28040 [Phytophthora fragariae]|uniref:Secreted protein n=1 Tax=Phytophthora fragariae TaxID=53985 RepID=A0A6A3Q279_9STRA|nr:hypothetical protein PF007_g28040 [Phytophthora fragariae]